MIMVYCFASKKVGIWPYFGFWKWGYARWGMQEIGKTWLDIEAQAQSWSLPHPPLRLVFLLLFFLSTHYSVVVMNWCVWVKRRSTCLFFNF
jgi:hypothetical protein